MIASGPRSRRPPIGRSPLGLLLVCLAAAGLWAARSEPSPRPTERFPPILGVQHVTTSVYTSTEWSLLSGRVERAGHTATYDSLRERMIIYGGVTQVGPVRDAQALSLTGQPEWTVLTSPFPMPVARFAHSAILDPVRDRLVVFGGCDNSPRALNDIWSLNLSANGGWSQLFPAGTPPSARSGHLAAYDPVRDRMLVFGGSSCNGATADTAVWAVNLNGPPAWTSFLPAGPAPRSVGRAFYDPLRDQLIVISMASGLHVWALSLSGTPTWTRLTTPGSFPGGTLQDAFLDPLRDRVVVVSTTASSRVDGLHALSLSSPIAWTSIGTPTNAPTPKSGPSVIYEPSRDRMVLYFGDESYFSSSYVTAVSEVWTLPLSPPASWSRLMPLSGPSARFKHSAVLDAARGRMLVFGGAGPYSIFNEVWALDLIGPPRWSKLAPAGTPPSARYGHAAIYDPLRDRMLVLSGAGGPICDVWQLTLSGTPTWTPLTPAGTPPTPRIYHTAIYDAARDRIVMFGGRSPSARVNDVWALTLGGTPTWTQLSPLGTPPTPRERHTAVLDPLRDRMVVCAGYDGTLLNDTWALTLSDPPTWSVIAATGPTFGSRYDHAAIYDPILDRMIVYGGQGATSTDQGYQVFSLSFQGSPTWIWLPAPLFDSGPNKRTAHSAIFDPGNYRMVVFGGFQRVTCSGPPDYICREQYYYETWAARWDLPVPATQVGLAACAGDAPLVEGGIVSTRPSLRFDLPGAVGLDVPRISITVDGRPVEPDEWRLAAADERSCLGPVAAAGVLISPRLSEGPHRLRASLSAADGSREGTLELNLLATDAFRILDLHVAPLPAGDRADIVFTLTRSAVCSVEFYDLLGRRVSARPPETLLPGPQRIAWAPGPSTRGRSGVYFYRLIARRDGRQLESRGRIVLAE